MTFRPPSDRERSRKLMEEHVAYCKAVLRGERPEPPGDPTLFAAAAGDDMPAAQCALPTDADG